MSNPSYKLALRSVNRYHLTYDEINSGAGNGTGGGGGGGGGGKKKKKEKGGDVEMTGGPADDGDDFEYVPRKTPLSAQRASKKGGADPSALWEECYTDDGEVYYYNTKTVTLLVSSLGRVCVGKTVLASVKILKILEFAFCLLKR